MLHGSSVWYGHRPFERKFTELLDMGFEYFEISLDYPFPEEADEIERAIREFNMQPAFHAPLDILLACPREEIFRASIKVLEKCIEFASKFDTLYFNLHLLHFSPTYIFPEVRGKILERVKEACNLAVKRGKDGGFAVCVENDRFFREEFIQGEIKLTLDIGHFAVDQIWWNRDYRAPLLDFAERHREKIHVIHVHDVSFAPLQDHLPLGKGELDLNFVSRLKEKLKAKYALLEVFWKEKGERVFATSEDLRKSLEIFQQL